MKISCEIIKDLLPLYYDRVCSDETKTMVEEHLACCAECRAALREMEDAFSIEDTEQNLKQAEAIQHLSKRWKKGMTKSVLMGVLTAILAVALLFLVLYLFVGFRIVSAA